LRSNNVTVANQFAERFFSFQKPFGFPKKEKKRLFSTKMAKSVHFKRQNETPTIKLPSVRHFSKVPSYFLQKKKRMTLLLGQQQQLRHQQQQKAQPFKKKRKLRHTRDDILKKSLALPFFKKRGKKHFPSTKEIFSSKPNKFFKKYNSHLYDY
jgi:hypothetical protein